MSGNQGFGDRDTVPPASSSEDRAPADRSPPRSRYGAIMAEGDQERWRLAKVTARDLFMSPALVTPRRLGLLGEEGLGAFVDEVRQRAWNMILRERHKAHGAPDPSSPEVLVVERSSSTQRSGRRPAAFKTRPAKERSELHRWTGNLKIDRAKRFASDVLVGAGGGAALLIVLIVAYRISATIVR